MSGQTDRLIAVLVILVGFLLVAQVSTVPANSLFGTLSFGVAVVAIAYAALQFKYAKQ
ncbi:hypothetical protein V5735_19355 [Haladaptatus sp. SPP-AMP-3]|uniref:hypothetical protein n=1 Tax=Haladaptatus sp. SPP-AMP-3 TaxID=3121295 RepID=UPI003C2B1FCC